MSPVLFPRASFLRNQYLCELFFDAFFLQCPTLFHILYKYFNIICMNVYTWIFTGLLVADIVIFIVGIIKNIALMEKIAGCFLIPFAAGIIISILTEFLPDSHHIIFISSFAFLFASLCVASVFGKKNVFKYLCKLFFVLAVCIWTMLIVSVYRIYRIPDFVFIISGAVYLAGLIVICFFIKKQRLYKYASALVKYAAASFLSFTSFISLVYEKRLYAGLMFTGSLATLFLCVLMIFQDTRPFAISAKTEKLIFTLSAVTSAVFLGTGALLMQV